MTLKSVISLSVLAWLAFPLLASPADDAGPADAGPADAGPAAVADTDGSPDLDAEASDSGDPYLSAQDDEAWDEDYRDTGRSFFYKEAVISSALSREGTSDVDLSHRPPGSYLAVDYVRTFTGESRINRALPSWLQVDAVDLHPRLVYYGEMPDDDMVMDEEDVDWPMPEGKEVDFAPQDFWIRFRLADNDRLTLRLGQIVLPYGVHPPLAPRQTFLLPVEELDLGLKWDWGIGLKGPLGRFDWELAATLGSGEAWHSPSFLGGEHPSSRLLTGRVGTPTYWDFQYGLSFLLGNLPTLHGPYVVDEAALSRWRLSLDSLYKRGTYLMLGGQVTYGEDGYDGDEEDVLITAGRSAAEVLGYRVFADWVPPAHNDFRLGGQVEALIRDLGTSDSTESAATIEVGYSLTTELTLKVDYRVVLKDFMGGDDNAFYVTLIYYGT